jgi:hypothetical protein
MTSRWSSRFGENGWIESSPKRRANAICWSSVMSWSRSTMTSWRTNAAWIAANCASPSGRRRSTPRISAPMLPPMRTISMPVAAAGSSRSRHADMVAPRRDGVRRTGPAVSRSF